MPSGLVVSSVSRDMRSGQVGGRCGGVVCGEVSGVMTNWTNLSCPGTFTRMLWTYFSACL